MPTPASVHVNASSAFAWPVCAYVAREALEFGPSFTLPFICDGVQAGDATWRGFLCYPFWGYGTMQLVIVFLLIFCWRWHSIEEVLRWNAKDEPLEASAIVPSRSSSPKGAQHGNLQLSLQQSPASSSWRRPAAPRVPLLRLGSALRVVDAGGSEESLLSVPEEGFIASPCDSPRSPSSTRALKRAGLSLQRKCKRIIYQVFQWWVLMTAVLVWVLFADMLLLREEYQPSVDYQIYPHPFLRVGTPAKFEGNIKPWLGAFSVYSFVALILVYSLSLLSIGLQVMTHFTSQFVQCNVLWVKGAVMISLPRDVAIQVLLLPMVYGLLASKSVKRSWGIMTDRPEAALECWNYTAAQKLAIRNEAAASDFALADMYEAWALYCFGNLVAKVMQPELRKKIRLDVVKAFEHLLLIDVSVFVFVCAVGAVYSIVLTWCKWRLGYDVCEHMRAVCAFQSYLVGANWCVSSIAIYNLFSIETKFEHLTTMQKFRPSLKFWSIKLMVFVAFWAGLVMALIRDMWELDDRETQLLDASFRIYVMAVVAIMNLKAWWPWSGWYTVVDQVHGTECAERAERRTGSKGFSRKPSEVGVKHVPPGTIYLIRKIFPELDYKPDDCMDGNLKQVEEHIKRLDHVGLDKALYIGSQLGWAVPTGIAQSDKNVCRRRAMIDVSHQQRIEALMEHLQSFYPEV